MPVNLKPESHLTALVGNLQDLVDKKYDQLKNSNLKYSKKAIRVEAEKYAIQALKEILFDMSQIKITKLANLVIEMVFESQKNFDRLVEGECSHLSRMMPFLRNDQIKGQVLENAGFKTICGELDKKALIERYVLNEVTIPIENETESERKNVTWARKVTVIKKKAQGGEKNLRSSDDDFKALEISDLDSHLDFTRFEKNPPTPKKSNKESRIDLNKTRQNLTTESDEDLNGSDKTENSILKNSANSKSSEKMDSTGEKDKNGKCAACRAKVVYQFNELTNSESGKPVVSQKKISDLRIWKSAGDFELISSSLTESFESDPDAASVSRKINFKPSTVKSASLSLKYHENKSSGDETSLFLVKECCSCSLGSDLDESESCSNAQISVLAQGRDSSSAYLDENRSSDKDDDFLISQSPEEVTFQGFDCEDVENYRNYLIDRYIKSSEMNYTIKKFDSTNQRNSDENANFSNYFSQEKSFPVEKLSTTNAFAVENPENGSTTSELRDGAVREDLSRKKCSENEPDFGENKKIKLTSTSLEVNSHGSPENKSGQNTPAAVDNPKKRRWATTAPQLILRNPEMHFDFVPIGEERVFEGRDYDSFLDGLEPSKTAQDTNAVMDFM